MKQKYTILRNNKNNALTIKESAELDKEILSFLCEQTYTEDSIKSAIAEGKEVLIKTLRTQNLYPPYIYMNKIADAVIEVYRSDNPSEEQQSADIFFNDLEFLTREPEEPDIVEEIEEEPEDIDDLLEDDIDDNFDDKGTISNINSIKIADDEGIDIDEEA
ncbi:hypothetical protein QUF80_13940 [Desulfococcaceae bacterium HSG8]|nr:hypothetical protein [Desulfococcaceae bacterium HSG8]